MQKYEYDPVSLFVERATDVPDSYFNCAKPSDPVMCTLTTTSLNPPWSLSALLTTCHRQFFLTKQLIHSKQVSRKRRLGLHQCPHEFQDKCFCRHLDPQEPTNKGCHAQ